MTKKLELEIVSFVENNIDKFHQKRFLKLNELNLKKVLKRKNPYLFKAKNILTAQDLVQNLLDAFLQSQEETLFGDFLEELAIFVCSKVYKGVKSRELEGIDLEFKIKDKYYIIEIKSGPNWGNSSQVNKMKDNFLNAKIKLSKKYDIDSIIAVNGCCYGQEPVNQKDGYLKLCGQDFWYLISNDKKLYLNIINPISYKAKEKNEEFLISYSRVINKFTKEFIKDFCDDGNINWEKLVKFNSQTKIV